MLREDTGEEMSPEESYEFIRELVDDSELPEWVSEEMEKLWENPESFERDSTLDEDLMENPQYLLFRLGIGFGIEYERKYPSDGEWRDSDEP